MDSTCSSCAYYYPAHRICVEWNGRPVRPTDSCGRWMSAWAEAVTVERIRIRPRVRPSAGLLAVVRPRGLILGAGARAALGRPERVYVEIIPQQAIVVVPADGVGHDSFRLSKTGYVCASAMGDALQAHGLRPGRYQGEMRGRELWLRPAGS